jgi:hypothetical protein
MIAKTIRTTTKIPTIPPMLASSFVMTDGPYPTAHPLHARGDRLTLVSAYARCHHGLTASSGRSLLASSSWSIWERGMNEMLRTISCCSRSTGAPLTKARS